MNIEIDAQAIDLFRGNGFEWQDKGRPGFRPVGFTDAMIEEDYRSGIYVVVDLPYLEDSGLAAVDPNSVPLSARYPHVKRKQLIRLAKLLEKIKTDMGV